VLFYFVGSGQGTVEAFRSLNALWHFTNYTVAHSHITMYGFVSFLIWGGIYGLLPRLTGQEPPHLLIGVHFWFALIGILIYGFSLMIGGTEQGESWISGAPFIDSVRLMASYWLWRAVSGSLMLAAHLLFAYNTWRMRPRSRSVQAAEPAGDPA
jgi:cytochrome c oxidase cbb3-type subunit I